MRLRKIEKNRGHLSSDEAATKLRYLALRNIIKDWNMPIRTWKEADNQFAIIFGDRFTQAGH
jgi:transposase-like protein